MGLNCNTGSSLSRQPDDLLLEKSPATSHSIFTTATCGWSLGPLTTPSMAFSQPLCSAPNLLLFLGSSISILRPLGEMFQAELVIFPVSCSSLSPVLMNSLPTLPIPLPKPEESWVPPMPLLSSSARTFTQLCTPSNLAPAQRSNAVSCHVTPFSTLSHMPLPRDAQNMPCSLWPPRFCGSSFRNTSPHPPSPRLQPSSC